MAKGKNTSRILKEICKQREMLAKAVAVVVVSFGLSLCVSATPMVNEQVLPQVNDSTPQVQQAATTYIVQTHDSNNNIVNGKYKIKGKVIFDNEPVIWATISDYQAKTSSFSDFDGSFEFCTDKEEVTLTVEDATGDAAGLIPQEINIKKDDYDKILTVTLEKDPTLTQHVILGSRDIKRAEVVARFLTSKEVKKYKRKGYTICNIKGQVVDKDNDPVIGATLADKKGKCVGVTNVDGEFDLYYINKVKEVTLIISHVDGVYKDLTITIKEEDLDKPLKIVMEDDEEALEELQKRQNWGY
ncbi:MAG: carboxypeptidase-like regulatory domain-containing protein [Bacteroidaceae bacterium]|nr:carboxypeptidase-like regulatory domain-containing protein [Bacteroidaceae bacterium]